MNVNWPDFNWGLAVLIFLGYMVVDAMHAYYTLSVAKLKPAGAATIGSAMYLILAFGVINYTRNWLYVIPLALGSWIGTYWAVRRAKNAE